jgi:hypothetical protein
VSLSFTGSDDADGFIGGSNPAWQINVTNNVSNPGCPSALQSLTWTDVTTGGAWVCGTSVGDTYFTFNDGNGDPGAIDFDVYVRIPNNAPTGAKSATISANANG